MRRNFIFLSLSVVLATCSLLAQVDNRQKVLENNVVVEGETALSTNVLKTPAAIFPGAFTLPCGSPIDDNLFIYGDKSYGYQTGFNILGHIAYGQVFKGTGDGSITKVTIYLLNIETGDAENLYAKVYKVGSNNLPTTTLLGTSQPVSTTILPHGNIAPVSFSFPTPVAAPTDFAVTIELPKYTRTGTLIVVASGPFGCFQPKAGDRAISNDGNEWTTLYEAWKAKDKGYDGMYDLAIFPFMEKGIGINTVKNDSISIYPNPASDKIFVENVMGSTIKIYDVSGKLLIERKSKNAREEIEVQYLNKGIYFIDIQNNHTKTIQKLMKK